MIGCWRHRMLEHSSLFTSLPVRRLSGVGSRLVGHRWCVMDGGGGGWMVMRQVRGDSQTGSPPAVPQQSSLCWNGDMAKNNIRQQQ